MSFNMAIWAWPQWAVFILMLLSMACYAYLHGQPKKDNWNAFSGWFSSLLMFFFLICGGFYG